MQSDDIYPTEMGRSRAITGLSAEQGAEYDRIRAEGGVPGLTETGIVDLRAQDKPLAAYGDVEFTDERGPAPIGDIATSEHILQFFSYQHLPPHLQAVSQHFYNIAQKIMGLPRNPERTVSLRKLLESKDAAVRAALAK